MILCKVGNVQMAKKFIKIPNNKPYSEIFNKFAALKLDMVLNSTTKKYDLSITAISDYKRSSKGLVLLTLFGIVPQTDYFNDSIIKKSIFPGIPLKFKKASRQLLFDLKNTIKDEIDTLMTCSKPELLEKSDLNVR